MKRNLIFGLAALCMGGCILLAMAWKASGAGPGSGSGILTAVNTARFAIVGAAYVTSSGQPESGVFKVDSYSGDTWMLKVDKASNGNRQAVWVQIQTPAATPAATPGE